MFQIVNFGRAREPGQVDLISDRCKLMPVVGRISRCAQPPPFLALGIYALYNLSTGFSFFLNRESENLMKEKETLSDHEGKKILIPIFQAQGQFK